MWYSAMNSEKDYLRRQLLAARRARPAEVRIAEAAMLIAHLSTLPPATTVCAYAPVGSEPGSPLLLDVLRKSGLRVLLPVVGTDTEPLCWAEYHPGELVRARFGLLEPAGRRLAPAALAEAGLVLVPALAVDVRGVRLGRGAGHYDRSLPLRDPAARLVAVVRDDELLDALPAEPHDVSMTDALTPGRGLVALG